MAVIAALLSDADERRSLESALHPHHCAWTDTWTGLDRLVRKRPVRAAVADPLAETRKDGALRVLRFVERYPETPLIAWDVREPAALVRLGRAGARDVVPAPHTENGDLVREIVVDAFAPDLATLLTDRLAGRVPDAALALVGAMAEEVEGLGMPAHAEPSTPPSAARGPLRVPDLADRLGVSVSTLERRCERRGAPPPGRILLWTRVLRGLMWMREPGRTVESVADRLGYSSGAAFSRAVASTVGDRPARLRGAAGLDTALERFADRFESRASVKPSRPSAVTRAVHDLSTSPTTRATRSVGDASSAPADSRGGGQR